MDRAIDAEEVGRELQAHGFDVQTKRQPEFLGGRPEIHGELQIDDDWYIKAWYSEGLSDSVQVTLHKRGVEVHPGIGVVHKFESMDALARELGVATQDHQSKAAIPHILRCPEPSCGGWARVKDLLVTEGTSFVSCCHGDPPKKQWNRRCQRIRPEWQRWVPITIHK
ncbi:MAG: hypothetical protein KJ626_08905 [Verrucomicrobia bacterium]|nr:hypothetical protein [Verrucomicrobiota bacterium]